MKVKCYFCGNEINAFELATIEINGKKKYVHTECYVDAQNILNVDKLKFKIK